jgi:hypothetical protein
MSTLREEIYVQCPVNQARARLGAFLADHTRLELRAAAVEGAPPLRHDVAVTMKSMPFDQDESARFTVHWDAIGGGPFPRFEGNVEVKGDEDYHSFRLVLEGRYDPPLGMIGDAFDAVVGRWIALATARDLLKRMRDEIEAAYRHGEEEKSLRG